MKQLFFALSLMLFACNLFAQEVILEEDTYVSYQDSMFILKEVVITNSGLDGVNDTLINYVPPAVDTSGLIELIRTKAANATNTKTAKMRNAFVFKKAYSTNNQYDQMLEILGSDLDVLNVELYANQLKGRYKVITDTTTFFVDVIDHPSLPHFLRATGTDNEGNFNIRVEGKWWFDIRIEGVWHSLIWDGDNRDRQVWRSPTWALPSVIAQPNTIRLIKTQ